MITKLEIISVHTDLDESLENYVNKKIGQLDQYVPRKSKESVHVTVRLKESKAKDNNNYRCEVVVHLPGETIDIGESTVNMYAAVDIVETKLKQQLKKYKELHTDPKFYRRLFSREAR